MAPKKLTDPTFGLSFNIHAKFNSSGNNEDLFGFDSKQSVKSFNFESSQVGDNEKVSIGIVKRWSVHWSVGAIDINAQTLL